MTLPGIEIVRDWRASYLLRDLWAARFAILAQLEFGKDWRGYVLLDPQTEQSYLRVECGEHLIMADGNRRYVVAVHHFNQHQGETGLHDHRFPFAVWPFDADGHLDQPLYEMPWETREADHTTVLARGVMPVCWGRPYAIEAHRQVFHAVRSHTPHYSLTLADDRLPPARPQRARAYELEATLAREVRDNAVAGLLCVLDEMAGEVPDGASAAR